MSGLSPFLSKLPFWFLVASTSNDHKLGNFTDTSFFLFQFWGPDVQSWGVSRVWLCLEALGDMLSCLSQLWTATSISWVHHPNPCHGPGLSRCVSLLGVPIPEPSAHQPFPMLICPFMTSAKTPFPESHSQIWGHGHKFWRQPFHV